MSDEELAYMGAAEIADKVRRRLLSPVEIVDACIARIERRNPSLNAFVFNGFDDARREAKAAEGAIMSGVAVGPLHGVPSAIKDLFDFKPGWPFTFGGVRAMRNRVADWHCIFAERIEKAGPRNHHAAPAIKMRNAAIPRASGVSAEGFFYAGAPVDIAGFASAGTPTRSE